MASDARTLWRRWLWAFTVGELAGFGIPSVVGGLGFWLTRNLDPAHRAFVLYAMAVPAGFGEGAVLAWFQARALRAHWPRLGAARWISATGLAAALAWACGLLAPTLDDVFGLSAGQQVAIWIPASLLILASIGGAQALVLRGVVAAPWRWLVANVVGWLAGLPWTFALPALLPDTAGVPVFVVTFIVAGTLMGLTAGAVTGVWVVHLAGLRDEPASRQPSVV